MFKLVSNNPEHVACSSGWPGWCMQGELIAAGQVPPIKGLPLEVPELVCCQGKCHPAPCPCVGAELGREMQCSWHSWDWGWTLQGYQELELEPTTLELETQLQNALFLGYLPVLCVRSLNIYFSCKMYVAGGKNPLKHFFDITLSTSTSNSCICTAKEVKNKCF